MFIRFFIKSQSYCLRIGYYCFWKEEVYYYIFGMIGVGCFQVFVLFVIYQVVVYGLEKMSCCCIYIWLELVQGCQVIDYLKVVALCGSN